MLKLIAKLVRLALVSILLAGLFVVAPAPRALAAAILVTTTNPNVNLGDGQCSLIEAINEANTTGGSGGDCTAGNAGADTIELGTGATYTLTGVDNTATSGPNGLPIIASDVTINGYSATLARGGADLFRIFEVNSTGALRLNNLIVTGGDSAGGAFGGAGIYNNGGIVMIAYSTFSNHSSVGAEGGIILNIGSLTIANSTFSNSVSFFGGGIYSDSGAVAIADSTFSGNSATYGGGIFCGAGTIEIAGGIFFGNSAVNAGDAGGGVYNFNCVLNIRNSLFDNNSALTGEGGGVFNKGEFTITNSTLSANTANYGGSLYSTGSGTVTITNSTLSNNIAITSGAGILNVAGVLTITSSVFSGNTASFAGGGFYNNGPTVIAITNSTFSGNRATTVDGGAFYNDVGSITVINSTISGNSAARFGGGIYSGLAATLRNTIIADNIGPNCSGNIVDGGNNLQSTDTSCGATIPVADPLLGPLADNGSLTQTHALLPGSPAIDAGNNFTCPSVDQRGESRPADGDLNGTFICDIGAYEVAGPLPPATPTPIATSTPLASPTTILPTEIPALTNIPFATPVGGQAVGASGSEFNCGRWLAVIPAGSVPDGSTLHCGPFDPNAAPGAPLDLQLFAQTINVYIYDRGGNRLTSFTPPLKMCYAREGYDDAEVIKAGGDPGNFVVITSEIGGTWSELPTTLNADARQACGETNHLTLFELSSRLPTEIPATGSAKAPLWWLGLAFVVGVGAGTAILASRRLPRA